MSDFEMKIPGFGVLEIADITRLVDKRQKIDLRVFSTHPMTTEIIRKAAGKLDTFRAFRMDPAEVPIVEIILSLTEGLPYDKKHPDLKLLCAGIQSQVVRTPRDCITVPGARWNF